MKTQGIQKATKKIGGMLSKNSPTILTGMSVAGLVTTSILAVRSTPKALRILDMENEYRQGRGDIAPITKVEAIKLTWTCYIPAAVMGSVAIACIIGSNSINLRRNAALASVYSLAEASLKEYQTKVIETIGEKKHQDIKDNIAKDKVKDHLVTDDEVFITGKGETLCYDSISGRYFKSDIEKIRKAENELNHDLLSDTFVSLNDANYVLGLENTKMGDEIGWTYLDSGMIAFEFSSQLTADGTPCLVIDYTVPPRYDYMDKH